jgi:hypothetical protein
MMSIDKNLVKFFYVAVFCCLATTAFLVGCGGGNNPGGPAALTSSDAAAIADTAQTSGSSSLIGRVVSDNQTPIGNVTVSLFIQESATGNFIDTGRKVVSLTSGEFNFNGIGTGTFVLKIAENPNFSESSKLAILHEAGVLDSGDMVVFAKTPDVSIPTLSLRARVVDPLSGVPLSVAQVSLDSGQTTVTNAFGIFELKNIASGPKKLTINQPGTASFSINIEVRGTTAPTADGIFFNNTLYPINASGFVDLVASGVNLTVNPNLHESGALMGTVKKFVIDAAGFPTSTLEAFGSYEFDLWQLNLSNNTARRFGSVVSNTDGTWRLDQLPPFEDNGFSWFAVPVNTNVQVQQADSGNVVTFSNSSALWANRDPVLAYGYLVKAGETTVMDFTVPSFVYSKVSSSVNAITDAQFSVNGAAPVTDAQAFLNDDLTFTWTGPGTSTEVILEFARIYKNPEVPTVSKSFKFTDSSATKAHSYKFKPSGLGLDFGFYTWQTRAIDPLIENEQTISDSHLMIVRPSATDLSPSTGANITIGAATYTVTFSAPTDPEADYAIMKLYHVSGGVDIELGTANVPSTTNQAVFYRTWSPNSPAAGTYRWKIIYYYSDGAVMDSETVTFQFVN